MSRRGSLLPLLAALAALPATLGGCDRDGEGGSGDGSQASSRASSPAEEPAPPPPPPEPETVWTCRLETMDFALGDDRRKATFIHDDQGRPVSATVTSERKKQRPMEVTWTYDDQAGGPLAEVSQGRSGGITYEYDEAGRLVGLDGRGYLSDRTLEYGDDGRVAAQVTTFRGRTFQRNEYGYAPTGEETAGDQSDGDQGETGEEASGGSPCPTTVKIFDRRGRHLETHALRWDDHPNPLAGLGAVLNPGELTLGHPVGACPHNLVEDVTTFERNTRFRRRGRRWKKGEQLTSGSQYAYDDEHGYPLSVQLDTAELDDEPAMRLTYDCREVPVGDDA